MLWLMLQSGLYYKKLVKTQNPRLINESGFKSRAAYDGARTVSEEPFDRIESNVTCLLDRETLYIFGQNLA